MDTPPVNDVNICVATANGSGSASSNQILYKSVFKMGIPCSGKNLFPSNIQGLPTWYFIRASGKGYLGRKSTIDVMVLFNEDTLADDVKKVRAGGLIVYDDSRPLRRELVRQDVRYIGVPAENLVKEHIKAPQLRAKQRNMIYVGAVGKLFGIPMAVMQEVLEDTFGNKPAVIESNLLCIELGYKHIESSGVAHEVGLLKAVPNGNKNKIMTEGNTACAIGAIYGGASVVPWYPITPSSSLVEEMIERLPAFRRDESGGNRYVVVQAEDELAAVSMLVGAGFAGARAMTSTAGPGLSLMQETIGLAYFVEVPGVIFVIQRGGPSTGLPTRTQQADITLMHQGSHGDTRHIVMIPHDNASAFDMAWQAFDVADRFQTPVFVMMDLDLGMNMSLSAPFAMPDRPFDRGKLLSEADIKAQGDMFSRYLDIDGDGITQRTIPGNQHPAAAYFGRGSGHDERARYSEDHVVYRKLLERLRRKYETAREYMPKPIIHNGAATGVGLISFGSSYEPTQEARDILAARGKATDHLLLRALPVNGDVRDYLAAHKEIYLIEQNRDGQMTQVLRDEFPEYAARIKPVCLFDGMPLAAGDIVENIMGGN